MRRATWCLGFVAAVAGMVGACGAPVATGGADAGPDAVSTEPPTPAADAEVSMGPSVDGASIDAASDPDTGVRDSSADVATLDSAADTGPAPDGAPADAGAADASDASDAGAADGGGVCPGGRYTVLERPTAGCVRDGSGLVLDNTTGVSWLARENSPRTKAAADDYCASLGMRLPSRDEALAIAGANYSSCAFPCSWATWTRSSAFGGVPSNPNYYVVASDGTASPVGSLGVMRFLCRNP